MLEIRGLTKRFGGLTAVNNVTAKFEAGHINAIIGPNGAGKTTFFNLIAGTHAPSSGQIIVKGEDVTGMRADQIARLGVARTFQATNLFDQASVLDNLIVGHRLRTRSGLWDVIMHTPLLKREEKLCREKAEEALEFVGLKRVAHRRGRPRKEGRARHAQLILGKAHRHVEDKARRHCNAVRGCRIELDPATGGNSEARRLDAVDRHRHASRHRPRDPPRMRAIMFDEREARRHAVARADLLIERGRRAIGGR